MNRGVCMNCGTPNPVVTDDAADRPTVFFEPEPSQVPPIPTGTLPRFEPVQSRGNEQLLVAYARFIKGFAFLLCLLAIIGCVVAIEEAEAWVVAIIVPGATLLTLPLFLIAAAIRVYCNMSLNLHRIDENLQKIVNSKAL